MGRLRDGGESGGCDKTLRLFVSALLWAVPLCWSCASAEPMPTDIVDVQPSGASPIPSFRQISATATQPGLRAEPYDQSSPERAVRSFARAYADGRYDVIVRFIPKHQLEGPDGLNETDLRVAWTGSQEVEQKFEALAATLRSGAGKIERIGDRATMPYGVGETVKLFVEDGVWKIDDL